MSDKPTKVVGHRGAILLQPCRLICLGRRAPTLIAIGGLSGSGKSPSQRHLPPIWERAPGARIFESDRIRKTNVRGSERRKDFQPEAYRPDVSDSRLQDSLRQGRSLTGCRGVTVIIDAVFDRPSNRHAGRTRCGSTRRSRSWAFWLQCRPFAHCRGASQPERAVRQTQLLEVLDMQEAKDIGTVRWRHIDARKPIETIVKLIGFEIEAE